MSKASWSKSNGPVVSRSGEKIHTGLGAGEETASSPASADRPSTCAALPFMASARSAVACSGPAARSTGVRVVEASPATLTRSTPAPLAPSEVHAAATVGGTTIWASLLEVAVLTTDPATLTGAAGTSGAGG